MEKFHHTQVCVVKDLAPEAQRMAIKSALNDIAAEVGDALRNAHLDFPVLSDRPEQRRRARHYRLPSRSVGRGLVTSIRDCLRDHQETPR